MKDRCHGHAFWRGFLLNYGKSDWMAYFRMSKSKFEYLASQLCPYTEKQNPRCRNAICHKKSTVIVWWWLATPCEYRTMATLFGIGISTLSGLVCRKELHVELPTWMQLDRTLAGFQRRGFSMCTCALDGTNIPIIAQHIITTEKHGTQSYSTC